MISATLSVAGAQPTAASSYNRRVLQAASEFEGQFLTSVFGALEKTFTAIGAPPSDPGAENYQAMSMQALGKSLAQDGGIGIAKLIGRHLLRP